MREILFKAKLKDWKTNPQQNKWVEGYYLSRKETTYCFTEDYERNPVKSLHYIAVDSMTDWGLPNEFRCYEINPDTLCLYTEQNIEKDKIWENNILEYDGEGCAKCIGVVKYGSYIQDGSGGEYGGRECIGFYVEMLRLIPYEWEDETVEEIFKYFPHYYKKYSLAEILKQKDVKKIGNVFDNPELLER